MVEEGEEVAKGRVLLSRAFEQEHGLVLSPGGLTEDECAAVDRLVRVRGKGGHKPDGGRGDLLLTVTVAVPKKPSKEQRELLEQRAALDGESPRRHLAQVG